MKIEEEYKEENTSHDRFIDKTWTYHHLSVFILTFISYTFYHASRKSFSTVKYTMLVVWVTPADLSSFRDNGTLFASENDAAKFMGVLDCALEFAYAITFAFGTLSEWFHLYNQLYYLFFWTLTGFFQSSGFPSEISVIGNWFGLTGRGWLFGLWASCQSFGNIVGALIAGVILPYGYELVFLVLASLMAAFGIVIFFGLVSAPRDIGLSGSVVEDSYINIDSGAEEKLSQRPEPVGFLRAVLLPGVISYSLAYACLKMVHYSIFFWLPFYLEDHFGWDNTVSDHLSTLYDWGAMIGGFSGGLASDWLAARTPVVISMLVASMGALYGYSGCGKNKFINGLVMGATGFFVGGTANVISAAVSADLGSQPEIQGNAEALATVTGIIDGTGSLGAGFGQIFVPRVQQWWSWNAVFSMFILLIFGAILCLMPICVREVKAIYRERCMKDSVEDEHEMIED